MSLGKTEQKLITAFLKAAVIFYLFPFFREFWFEPGFEQAFWFWTMRVVYLAVYIGLILIIAFLKRRRFYNFGFMLVFISTTYKMLNELFTTGYTFEHATYILLLVISIYFMSKTEKSRKKKSGY